MKPLQYMGIKRIHYLEVQYLYLALSLAYFQGKVNESLLYDAQNLGYKTYKNTAVCAWCTPLYF